MTYELNLMDIEYEEGKSCYQVFAEKLLKMGVVAATLNKELFEAMEPDVLPGFEKCGWRNVTVVFDNKEFLFTKQEKDNDQ